jgi:hypothetical protein
MKKQLIGRKPSRCDVLKHLVTGTAALGVFQSGCATLAPVPSPGDLERGHRAGFLGHIAEVKSITINDRLVAYQARVERPVFFVPGMSVISSTVQVAADGKKLDHKE